MYGKARCVRKGYNVPSGVGVRIDGGVFCTISPFCDQRWGYRRRPDRHPQTIEDLTYRLGRVDRAEDSHPAAAAIALQCVHSEDPLQQLRPGVSLGALFLGQGAVCGPNVVMTLILRKSRNNNGRLSRLPRAGYSTAGRIAAQRKLFVRAKGRSAVHVSMREAGAPFALS